MARARNLKPGFFRNEILAELPPLSRLLFAGLWTIADKAGRLEDRPKRIKADVLPYDDGDVSGMLDQLAGAGFIVRYAVNGERYIQITNFSKHQNPHVKEGESIIPAPDETGKHHTSTVQAPDKHDASFPLTDSLNPLMGNGEPIGGAANAANDQPPADDPKPKQKRAARIPADFTITDAMRKWASERGATVLHVENETEKFVNYWTAESGAKASKLDWVAAWKVWMGRNLNGSGSLTVHRGGRETATEEDFARWRQERNGMTTVEDSDAIETTGRLA